MTLIGSLIGGAIAALALWLAASAVAGNLPSQDGVLLAVVLVCGAGVIGVLVGGAVSRRAVRDTGHVRMFSTVATGFGVGTIAALTVAAITASYLVAYGHMPDDLVGQILFVLAIPAFSLLAWFVGAGIGAGIGLVTGTVLQGLAHFRR